MVKYKKECSEHVPLNMKYENELQRLRQECKHETVKYNIHIVDSELRPIDVLVKVCTKCRKHLEQKEISDIWCMDHQELLEKLFYAIDAPLM